MSNEVAVALIALLYLVARIVESIIKWKRDEESKKGDTPPKGTEPAAARNGETAKQEDRPEASGTPKPQAAEKKRKPKATKKKTAKPKGKKK